MVMTDRSFGLTIPYEYLQDIRSKTLPFVEMLTSPISLILNGVVSPIIRERAIHWSSPENTEYSSLVHQISSIQNVLIENIDILLERGEKLDLLVSRAKNLAIESSSFRRQSHRMQQSSEWPLVKKMVILFLAGIFTLTVYIILAINCGGLFLTKCIYKLPSSYVSEPYIRISDDDQTESEVIRHVEEFISELKTE
ncbi:synaptobrevin-like protein [Cryptosporidium canis]|uniref:Synaptobrevin-like protein n=1 Tax=Cryptosporidium canis TaxID=195482 RepID=A0ABQ8P9R7_9CRYT|nr:synaptobrevin-like protein [Cryptosporidium canis]